MNLCHYGCKSEAKYQFKNGIYCCSKYHSMCPKIREQNAISSTGKFHSLETIKKMKKSMKGLKHLKARNKVKSLEHRNKISSSLSGKAKSAKHKKKLSDSRIGRFKGKDSPNWGKKYNEQRKISIRKSLKKLWEDYNSIFYTDQYRNKMKEARNLKPNKLETTFKSILNSIFLNDYVYCGDYSFFIGRKNPDFLNKEKKKIIEIFGSYYHGEKYRRLVFNDYSTNLEHEQKRIDYFKKFGYDTLIIWETEILDVENIKRRIVEFTNG